MRIFNPLLADFHCRESVQLRQVSLIICAERAAVFVVYCHRLLYRFKVSYFLCSFDAWEKETALLWQHRIAKTRRNNGDETGTYSKSVMAVAGISSLEKANIFFPKSFNEAPM